MKSKLLPYYTVPLLMLIVIAFQFNSVSHGLTRWKGGGFGMYTTPHPNNFSIWIEFNNNKFEDLKSISALKNNPEALKIIDKFHRYPVKYKKELKQLIENATKAQVVSYIIYMPYIDKDNVFFYKEYQKDKF